MLEEIGRNLSPSPFLTTAIAAVEALKGTAHAARWFPGILAGDTVAALAIDEGAKHRDSVGLKAERSGNGFRLTGKKQFVTHGHVADLLIVAARTAGSADDVEGVTLFAIPKDAANLTATPERLADSSIAARLDFDGVEVDADAVIGEVDNGRSPLDRLLRAGRDGRIGRVARRRRRGDGHDRRISEKSASSLARQSAASRRCNTARRISTARWRSPERR